MLYVSSLPFPCRRRLVRGVITTVLSALCLTATAAAQPVSLTSTVTPYTQNFDALANTAASTTNNVAIPGWSMTETGGGTRDNEQYAVDTGASNAGDTYSYGSAGATDRAFGGLQSGTLIPVFGAAFTNDTGVTVTSLTVTYSGEQWRTGNAAVARDDRLDFQYSLDASSLTSGTWINTDGLDFSNPIKTSTTVGALDGNADSNRGAVTATITGLSIANGATFWIRWQDFNATGADDGLAVDDFSLTPRAGSTPPPTPGITLNQSGGTTAVAEGGATDSYSLVLNTQPTAAVQIAVSAGSQVLVAPTLLTFSTTDWSTPQVVTVTAVDDTDVEGAHTGTIGHLVVSGDTSYDFLTIPNVVVAIADNDVTLTTLSALQGSGAMSPFAGQSVTTRGIVTATKSNGFFIQSQPADDDGNPATSEGLFVFTSGAPPAAAGVGNLVSVTGLVSEFVPTTAAPGSQTVTELTSPVVSVVSSGNPVPGAATLTSGHLATLDGLERYEGMLVTIPSLTVVAPTGGTISEANATSVSNGEFWGVITSTQRPFREPGLDAFAPLPVGAPATVTRWDSNPERIRIDSNAVPFTTAIDRATGAVIDGITGLLDVIAGAWTIQRVPSSLGQVTQGVGVTAAPNPVSGEATVASLNFERFFDTINDAGVSDVALTAAALETRLAKASLTVRTVLQSPDILATVEIENLAVLQTLAARIDSDAAAAGGSAPGYQAYLVEGNDVGGIDVGFLVKATTTQVTEVTQFGATTTFVDPNNGQSALLNDRPPLALRATITPPGGTAFPITVVANHLRSLNGVGDPLDGDRVRAKRKAQAEFLADWVQARQIAAPAERILLVGDFNAFEFSDGYVDVIGTIKGTPAPASTVVTPTADLVTPDLVNLVEWVPPAQRYSYLFEGSAQVLDHALITQNLSRLVSRVSFSRSNADQPEVLRGDAASPARLSDHDGIVVGFAAGTPALVATVDSVSADGGTVTVRFSNTGTGNLFNLMTDSLRARPLVGTGTVTPVTTVPVAIAPVLGPGQSVTATFVVTVPSTVSRYALAAAGSYQNAAAGLLRFSATLSVSK